MTVIIKSHKQISVLKALNLNPTQWFHFDKPKKCINLCNAYKELVGQVTNYSLIID